MLYTLTDIFEHLYLSVIKIILTEKPPAVLDKACSSNVFFLSGYTTSAYSTYGAW